MVKYHWKLNMNIEVNNMNGIPQLNEKCTGAFVASAIGDALGWPNEFRSSNTKKQSKPVSDFIEWQRRTGGRYWSHTEKILAGEYSDDTQMILAVARSLLSGKSWSSHFITNELPFWLEYERGGGRAMQSAASSWKNKTAPWQNKNPQSYFSAGGNGAAMRVLPHIVLHIYSSSFEPIADEIVTDAMLTHGHPRAIVGALCFAYALYYLFKKESTLSYGELVKAVCEAKSQWGQFPTVFNNDWLSAANIEFAYNELWHNTVEATVHALEIVLEALSKGLLDSETETLSRLQYFDKAVNGAGDISAVVSIYLASKYANNPSLGLKSAANALGGDTDTIASMTGGLLGTICGMEWIPIEWKFVQDYDCLVRMANFLLKESKAQDTNGNKLEQPQREHTSIGNCKRITTYELPSGKTGTVRISKYMTALGQTFYVKKFFREKTLESHLTQTPAQPLQKYSILINSSQILSLKNDFSSTSISLVTVLNILEIINQGITDLSFIAKKAGVSIEIIQKLNSLLIIDDH